MYPSYEILIIENNSTEEATFSYYKELEAQGIRVLKYPKQGFNYSAINNFGVKEAKGEYLLFLNNDMEIITPDFMEKMVSNLQRPQIGAVGAKLYYPDNTVQHAGIIIGIGGIAGHAFLGLARGRSGYLHKASLQMNVSAVTAACMMMKKEVFEEVGGFEEELSVAFNDVDLCLRIGKAGYKIVYNPHVELYHYESKSRGAEDDEKKRAPLPVGNRIYAQPLDWAVKGRRSLLQSKFNAGIVELWTACRRQGSKTMDKVAVVIPNYNGYRYLETCFAALAKQTFTEFTTYFVDNGSQDESCAFLREHYPETKIIQLDDNYGFSRAVNEASASRSGAVCDPFKQRHRSVPGLCRAPL